MTKDRLQAGWAALRRAAAGLGHLIAGSLIALWQLVRAPLLGLLSVVAALVVLFEEWGWRPLAELLGAIARLRPFARLELWIAGLPPYAALLVFALPTTLLLPVKLLGLWLLAKGQAVVAALMLVGAKIVSTALVARIFMLTKPALMRIGWFAAAYGRFMPWKEAVFAKIRASWTWRYGRMVKNAIRLRAKQAWTRWSPGLLALRTRMAASFREMGLTARLIGQRIWRDVRNRLGLR